MNPQHAQGGLVSNYLPGNPAQQNQTYSMGMGNAATPFVSNAAPPFLGNAAQYYQGYAAPHLMGNYYQGNAAPTYGNTGNAANWPMSSAGKLGTSESASTSSRGTKHSHTEWSDWSTGEEEDEIDPTSRRVSVGTYSAILRNPSQRRKNLHRKRPGTCLVRIQSNS